MSSKWIERPTRAFLAWAVIAGMAVSASAQQLPAELAAGFKAGFTCSAVFHAGRTLEQILADELGNLEQFEGVPDPEVDYASKSVTCAYSPEKVPRLAVFVDGLGTVLLPPGATLTDREALPNVAMPMPGGDPAKIPWPDGDLLPEAPLPPEVDKERLDKAIDVAFVGEKYRPHKTLGIVVVYKDRLVAERYAEGWNMHTQYRTWSAAKSITNALIGILVRQGKLHVEQPAPIPDWHDTDDPRRQITIEHLLEMSSGLKGEGAMTLQAYWGGIDTAGAAAAIPFDVEPGSRWEYSNYDTLLLVRTMREVLPDFETYLTFPRSGLLNEIGMRHTFPETDPQGNFILSSQVYTTPRDLARFGLLFLHDGVWNGTRILPEGWVEYSMTPAPAHKRGPGANGYGKQWWLPGFDPRVPEGSFQAAGHRGQFATVVPSMDLVITRMGLDPMQEDDWNQSVFVADVISAIRNDAP